MSLKTFPETPAEEAARINAASGDPDGITAEQVAANRKLNQSLTSAFGFGGASSTSSFSALPTSPFAQLVSGISAQISADTVTAPGIKDAGLAKAAQISGTDLSKINLDRNLSAAAGEFGSGLNGMTSGAKNLAGQLGADARAFASNLGSAAGQFAGIAGTAAGAISQIGSATAGLQSLANSAAASSSDISNALSKLTGGSLATGLSNLTGAISKAAGTLNDILSLRRGINIPAGAEYVKQQGSALKLQPGSKDDWRVKIRGPWEMFGSNMFKVLENTGGVVFPYLPSITVTTKANYTNVDLVHSNYPYYAYKNSTIDEIQIAGEFSSESETDAAYWIAATTFFKTATKMFFGQGENAGHPPIICNLSGYGASVFDRVPIIITNFSVDLKDDVNYIKCNTWGTNTWVPVLSNISVSVIPIYSRESLRKFDLKTYASGKMVSTDGIGYL
jgi:hypothetical protein